MKLPQTPRNRPEVPRQPSSRGCPWSFRSLGPARKALKESPLQERWAPRRTQHESPHPVEAHDRHLCHAVYWQPPEITTLLHMNVHDRHLRHAVWRQPPEFSILVHSNVHDRRLRHAVYGQPPEITILLHKNVYDRVTCVMSSGGNHQSSPFLGTRTYTIVHIDDASFVSFNFPHLSSTSTQRIRQGTRESEVR